MALTLADFGVELLTDGSIRVPRRAKGGRVIGDGTQVLQPGSEEFNAWERFIRSKGLELQ